MTFPPLLFCLQSQFDQFNNILHVIAFSLREIILVGFLVYVYKEDLFVYFEINILSLLLPSRYLYYLTHNSFFLFGAG